MHAWRALVVPGAKVDCDTLLLRRALQQIDVKKFDNKIKQVFFILNFRGTFSDYFNTLSLLTCFPLSYFIYLI